MQTEEPQGKPASAINWPALVGGGIVVFSMVVGVVVSVRPGSRFIEFLPFLVLWFIGLGVCLWSCKRSPRWQGIAGIVVGCLPVLVGALIIVFAFLRVAFELGTKGIQPPG